MAFKEWAVVVDALGQGGQILILRKGGIHEGAQGFQPEHERFWLFPTAFHQQREAVVPAARNRFDDYLKSCVGGETVPIQFLAELARAIEITSLDAALDLRNHHIWTEEVIRSRFDWGGSLRIHALLLRIYRLPQAVQLPMSPAYGGCRSWIELERDLPEQALTPVLSDGDFGARCARIENRLCRCASRS